MFELDFRSRIPIYEQLVAGIRGLIIGGVLKPDEQLPSVRALAGQLTVNPNTVQKAYRELERQGYIYPVPGKGYFVRPAAAGEQAARKEKLQDELSQVILELSYLGMDYREIISVIKELISDSRGGHPLDD